MPQFHASRLKIERAYKHVRELEEWIDSFAHSEFYAVSVKKDPKCGRNSLVFTIKHSPSADAAIILGDALHNLKSALDILWNEVFTLITNRQPDDYTRFPFRKTAKELESAIRQDR